MKKTSQRGFTLTELLMVIVIIGILMTIVVEAVTRSRSSGRDGQVRSDKATISLALARTAEFSTGGKYPGSANTWYCLKTTGTTCFNNNGTVNSGINNLILANMPGHVFIAPPIYFNGESRYDSYVYTPSYASWSAFSGTPLAGYTGPVLLWWQEKAIPTTDCNGFDAGQIDGAGVKVWYCYEKLQ